MLRAHVLAPVGVVLEGSDTQEVEQREEVVEGVLNRRARHGPPALRLRGGEGSRELEVELEVEGDDAVVAPDADEERVQYYSSSIVVVWSSKGGQAPSCVQGMPGA